jgi:hypothetical protein
MRCGGECKRRCNARTIGNRCGLCQCRLMACVMPWRHHASGGGVTRASRGFWMTSLLMADVALREGECLAEVDSSETPAVPTTVTVRGGKADIRFPGESGSMLHAGGHLSRDAAAGESDCVTILTNAVQSCAGHTRRQRLDYLREMAKCSPSRVSRRPPFRPQAPRNESRCAQPRHPPDARSPRQPDTATTGIPLRSRHSGLPRMAG